MEKEEGNSGLDLVYTIREEMGDSMPIDIWYEGEVFVFRPFGRIDAGHSTDLDAALTEGVEQGMNQIVIDLTDTLYIASSGLRAIIKAAKAVRNTGGKIVICAMNEQVLEVFRLSGLLKVFTTFPDVQKAVRSFQ
jgi:anti-anti-sigma factor